MKKILLAITALGFSCIFSSAYPKNSESNLNFSFKKVDGQLISRAKTYTLNSKKIVLIGMTHVAPREFYLGVSEYMNNFKNGYKTIIMREGVHRCDENFGYYLTLGKVFDYVKSDEIFKKAQSTTEFNEEDIVAAGFIKKYCERKNYPTLGFMGFILSPFSPYGRMAMSTGMRSQTGFARLYPKEIDSKLGDAAISGMPFSEQMIFAVVSSCFSAMVNPEKSTDTNCHEAVRWLNSIPSEVIEHAFIKTRNIVVVGKALQQLGIPLPEDFKAKYAFTEDILWNRQTVIIPWGGAHLQEIASMIEAQGFQLQSTFDIPVASCKRVIQSKVLKKVFSDTCNE